MSVRVASLCTWAKPGRDSPPSLQLAALWGHLPRALGGRGLDFGAFSLLRPADSCSPWVPPSTPEGERSQTPRIPELRREGPVHLREVTISASREGRSPGPDLATAPPHHWATHGIGLELWLGRNQCYGNSSWLGWRCSCPEADSGWAVWFGNLPLPPKEGGIHHREALPGLWLWAEGDAGRQGFHVSAKLPSSALKCVSDPLGSSGFTVTHS